MGMAGTTTVLCVEAMAPGVITQAWSLSPWSIFSTGIMVCECVCVVSVWCLGGAVGRVVWWSYNQRYGCTWLVGSRPSGCHCLVP